MVIAGRYTGAGELVMVGRTVPLTAAQSAEFDAVLKCARRGARGPNENQPQRWAGRGSKKPVAKGQLLVVIDVLADAPEAGRGATDSATPAYERT
ncbi:hypothetical protein AB0F43_06665 [Kribbella sp. NPDC023972]|uniref:hypothetical protein n=1 Tax=Kribbella sp. NPDC023972 TaxID=3154795 RepID=UPI0033ED556E